MRWNNMNYVKERKKIINYFCFWFCFSPPSGAQAKIDWIYTLIPSLRSRGVSGDKFCLYALYTNLCFFYDNTNLSKTILSLFTSNCEYYYANFFMPCAQYEHTCETLLWLRKKVVRPRHPCVDKWLSQTTLRSVLHCLLIKRCQTF